MKRFLCFLVFLILLQIACSASAAQPTATVTPIPPTDTPIPPTSTPIPTDTPTQTPTSTPDVAVTAAVRATQNAADVLDELSGTLGDSDVPYRDGHLLWQQTDDISVDMSGPANLVQTIDDMPETGNFILKSEVTWNTSGIILCGVIFRSEKNVLRGKQYQFLYLRLSGLPAWAIEVHDFGQFQNTPTGVKFSDALNLTNNSTNKLFMVVQDETFTLYINDKRQGKYYDYSKQRSSGVIAFMGSQDSGEGSCTFENSWVWSLDQ